MSGVVQVDDRKSSKATVSGTGVLGHRSRCVI